MRPSRLEIEGFSIFGKRTVVEFGTADLFVITGPTGVGKSSILDAIVFALYGSVYRYGQRAVKPVITQGLLQARVRLDFTVGHDSYTIARLVRRKGAGDAMLERKGVTLAQGTRHVNLEVEKTLGLDFNQFTTCVALPQGDFHRFLRSNAKDRQDLLIALLDLYIYERVRRLASDRRKSTEARVDEISAHLRAMGDVPEVEDAEALAASLASVISMLDRVEPEIEELGGKEADARARSEEHRKRGLALAALRRPRGLNRLMNDLSRAHDEAIAAEESEILASRMVFAVESALAGRSSSEITVTIDRLRELNNAEQRLADARNAAVQVAAQLDKANTIATAAATRARVADEAARVAEAQAADGRKNAREFEGRAADTDREALMANSRTEMAEKHASEAEKRAKAADQTADAADSRTRQAEQDTIESERRAKAADQTADAADSRTRQAEQDTIESERRAKAADQTADAADSRARQAEQNAAELEGQAADVDREAVEAENRAERAGEDAQETERRAEAADGEAEKVTRQASEAEGQAVQADEQVRLANRQTEDAIAERNQRRMELGLISGEMEPRGPHPMMSGRLAVTVLLGVVVGAVTAAVVAEPIHSVIGAATGAALAILLVTLIQLRNRNQIAATMRAADDHVADARKSAEEAQRVAYRKGAAAGAACKSAESMEVVRSRAREDKDRASKRASDESVAAAAVREASKGAWANAARARKSADAMRRETDAVREVASGAWVDVLGAKESAGKARVAAAAVREASKGAWANAARARKSADAMRRETDAVREVASGAWVDVLGAKESAGKARVAAAAVREASKGAWANAARARKSAEEKGKQSELAQDKARGEGSRAALSAQELASMRSRAEEKEGTVQTLCATVADLRTGLRDVGDIAALENELDEVVAAEERLGAGQQAKREAEKAKSRADQRLTELEGERSRAAGELKETCGRLAEFGPPEVDMDAPDECWSRVLDWAKATCVDAERRVQSASKEADGFLAEQRESREALKKACDRVSIDTTGRRMRDAVVDAAAVARSDVAKARERAKVRERLREATEQAQVVEVFTRMMHVSRFPKWLLATELQHLADRTERRLSELTSGRYQLAVSADLDLEIVDHHSASERRSVQSLSGGETFLVSLALALALADHVADATEGVTRLESLFLDEGFGALDPEMLETVSAAVGELGASGKTVGLITHVKELADQMPVRFEVRKTATGAVVKKVVT